MLLDVLNLSKSFGSRIVLDNISFSIEKGELVGLYGESGIGKSTLARILTGTIIPDSGDISIDGESIFDRKHRYKAENHLKIQLVQQEPSRAFDPIRSVGYSLNEAIRANKVVKKEDMAYILSSLMTMVALDSFILERKPRELSGGQIQRVAIARAISLNPYLLIADEATSMLDDKNQRSILDLLLRIKEEKGLSLLMISHDRSLLSSYCNRVLYIDKGGVIR